MKLLVAFLMILQIMSNGLTWASQGEAQLSKAINKYCRSMANLGFMCSRAYNCKEISLIVYGSTVKTTGDYRLAENLHDFCQEACKAGPEAWDLSEENFLQYCRKFIMKSIEEALR